MVLLRLGWLTVLSSMYIVEQELYFLVRSPGDIWGRNNGSRRATAIWFWKRVHADLGTHVIHVVAFPFLTHCNGRKERLRQI